jgi:hypothetical protein
MLKILTIKNQILDVFRNLVFWGIRLMIYIFVIPVIAIFTLSMRFWFFCKDAIEKYYKIPYASNLKMKATAKVIFEQGAVYNSLNSGL